MKIHFGRSPDLPSGDPATSEFMAEAKARVRFLCECGKEAEEGSALCEGCLAQYWLSQDPFDPAFRASPKKPGI